ncbi:LolA family protein [Actinopolymorpha pittospori]
MFASRPALRWFAPAAVLALVLLVGTAGTLFRANAAGALPERTAAQLLVDLQKADPDGFSGTVSQQADLGLPQLPGIGGSDDSSDLSSLVSGSHTLKVWYDGPERSRIALLGTLGESDLIRDGKDVWVWSSTSRTATHTVLPASKSAPAKAVPDLPRTPQEAADQALKALDPSTKVTTDGTASVAGRAAYQLILAPRDASSLVGQVRLAIDSEQHIPLQVQVFAKGAGTPAIQVGFTQISFAKPSAEHFRFAPPPGTKVTEGKAGDEAHPRADRTAPGEDSHARGDQQNAREQGADKGTGAKAAADRPSVVGKGWTAVVTAKMPTEARHADSEFRPILDRLPRVSGTWGSGRLLSGALFSVLVTDDGRVLAGAVSPQRLYSVAGTAR